MCCQNSKSVLEFEIYARFMIRSIKTWHCVKNFVKKLALFWAHSSRLQVVCWVIDMFLLNTPLIWSSDLRTSEIFLVCRTVWPCKQTADLILSIGKYRFLIPIRAIFLPFLIITLKPQRLSTFTLRGKCLHSRVGFQGSSLTGNNRVNWFLMRHSFYKFPRHISSIYTFLWHK